MRRLLLNIWSLPWPPPLRQRLKLLSTSALLQRLLFPSFLVGVVGLIENDRAEFLLLRHTYRHQYPWGLPSGWLERGEQPADALKREIREETGFLVDVGEVCQVYAEQSRRHISIVLRGRYEGGSFEPSAEVSDAHFFALPDVPELLPSQKQLLRASPPAGVSH